MENSENNQGVKKFYVYGHYTTDGALYYVGAGTIVNLETKRPKSRFSRAYHTHGRSKFWRDIKDKYGLVVKILELFETREESFKKESELISLFKRQLDGGNLSNLSTGGAVGPVGRPVKMSEAQKAKLSDKKSIYLYIYNSRGEFLTKVRNIKNAAKYCGVTYNAVHSCMKTQNYTNGYFCFRSYKGEKLGYSYDNLSFKSPLSKKVYTQNLKTREVLLHESLMDCVKYLKADRSNLQKCLKKSGICKGHKIYLEGAISSQAFDKKEGSTTISKESTLKRVETANT